MNNITTTNTLLNTNYITTTDTIPYSLSFSSSGSQRPIVSMDIELQDFSKIVKNSLLGEVLMNLNNELIPISKVEILAENKVIRFTFKDSKNTTIKTICSFDDTFNFEKAFYIAYSKYYFGSILTAIGIEKLSEILPYHKKFNKAVEKAKKLYYKTIKEEEEKAKKEAELKEIKRRQREKKIRKKKERREKSK